MEKLLQNLWAETTLNVVNRVAWKQGERMYRNDWELRDDLHSWLLVKAQEAATRYEPDFKHPNPERSWGAYLWNALIPISRWHWGEYHGSNEANKEAARRTVHMSTLIEDRDGQTMALPAMSKVTGTPELSPEAFYEKLEHLEETLQHLQGGPLPPKPQTCIEWGCDAPALKSKPRCPHHNNLERSWHKEGQPCGVKDCTNSATNFRGLCHIHYQKLVNQGPLEPVFPTCTFEGCAEPLKRSTTGLCKKHYRQQVAASAPQCSIQGCSDLAKAKGLCQQHYRAQLPFKECSTEGCTNKVSSRGLCRQHGRPAIPCDVEGCSKQAHTRGLCQSHYKKVLAKEKANG